MGRAIVLPLLVCACAFAGAEPAESAAALLTSGNFRGAAEVARSALAKQPGSPELWNILGVCESELGRGAQARAAFERGLKLAPSWIALYENYGFLLYRERDYAEARRYLAEAIRLGSASPGVAFSLAASQIRTRDGRRGLELLRRLESPLGNKPDYWTERGWAELAADTEAAARSFDRALSLDGDDVRALNGAASAAEAAGGDEKALAFLLRAKRAHPDDLRTLLHFGSVCLRRDLTIDALEALERARKMAPENDLALFLYARVQIAFQQWQQSHDLFSEFDRRVPNYAPAQYALGWLDLKLNRTQEARRHLDRSIALDSGQLDALYELAQLDLSEGLLDAAGVRLRSVLEKQPGHAKANIAMGDLLLRRSDLVGARKHYEAAIESDAASGPAHYKLSTVLLRLNEPERAAREREIGARLNQDATKAAKTVLVLSDPAGRLLSGVKANGDP